MNEEFTMNTFLLVPMTIILLVSLANVFIAIRGKFHPADVMWKGLGGAIYVLGFGWVVTDNMSINTLSGSVLMWGIAVKLIPRLVYLLVPHLNNAART